MDFEKILAFIRSYFHSVPERFKKLITGIFSEKESKAVRKARSEGIWKTFFKMLFSARIPYISLGLYVAIMLYGGKLGISNTELTAEITTGDYTRLWTWVYMSLLSSAIGMMQPTVGTLANINLGTNLRKMTSKKIMWIKPSFYIENEPRELVSRTMVDTTALGGIVISLVGTAARMPAFITRLQIIGEYGWDLVLTVLGMAALAPITAYIFGRLQMHRAAQASNNRAGYTQYLGDRMANIPVIKTFLAEKREEEKGNEGARRLMNINIKETAIANMRGFVNTVIRLVQIVVICYVGVKYLGDGRMDKREAARFFLFAVGVISSVLTTYLDVWMVFKTVQGTVNRIARVMQTEEEDMKSGIPVSEEDLQNDIVFEDVVFGYKEKNVLNGVSFTVPRGKLTAIVGHSGSGKSTIVKLVERFYEPRSGEIKLGGESSAIYNLGDWRENMGYVTQETALMTGTIRDNILYGIDHEVSEAEFEKVCKLADIYSFVGEQQNGFDTQVGEYGSRLSGGQKQRIVLARAALKDPKVLLLDEPTAALDPAAEDAVRRGIKALAEGRTTILVSHKIAHIVDADQIVLIDCGLVAGIGTHQQLVATNARYKELFSLEAEEGAGGHE